MERSRSNADNLTFNGTLNATTNSTPVNMPRDESSTERRDGSSIQASVEDFAELLSNGEHLCLCCPGYLCLFCGVIGSLESTSLIENTHIRNTGSGERTTYVVNPYTQTIIPEIEGELGEVEVDMPDLFHQSWAFDQEIEGELGEVEMGMPYLFYQSWSFDRLLFEFDEHTRNAQFRATDPYLYINLYKYEGANSTCPDSKEHCCICLEEYYDGEEIARIDCGHLYHVGCIKEWNKLENTCPICRRRVSAMLP